MSNIHIFKKVFVNGKEEKIKFIKPIPVTYEQIQDFEKEKSVILPKSYKEFLAKYNDGDLIPSCSYPIKEIVWNSAIEGICSFHSLTPSTKRISDLDGAMVMFENRIPKEFIPIGRDGCGNKICLCISGENYGKLYFWDHEEESDDDNPTYDNLYLIADSFKEFLDSLSPNISEPYTDDPEEVEWRKNNNMPLSAKEMERASSRNFSKRLIDLGCTMEEIVSETGLSEEDVVQVRHEMSLVTKLLSMGRSIKEIADETGLSEKEVKGIKFKLF